MKANIFLLLTLLFLIGCQASGDGAPAGGIISGHAPVDNKFTLTTTMNKTYLVTETIDLVLNFPKPVDVTGGIPSIEITLGANVRTVPMSSGDGTTSLTFSYVVVPGDDDMNGISVSEALNKNGASIKYDTTFDTTSIIKVPNLSTVLVNTISGTPPVAANISPASFNEDTQSIMTLSYTDVDSDLATSCAISAPVKVTVTQPCACAAGVCTVGVTGTPNSTGAASFNYTVTANFQVSNSATSSFALTPVADTPVATNISPAAFNEDTQSIITLSYTDGDGDLAISCNISSPTNITVTQACGCAAGVCTVGVTGTSNYSGAASFNYTVTANGQTSNSALASLSITAVGDAPVAANITPAAFNEDVQSVITLSYTDVESNLATTCAISSPTNVTVTQACACAAGVCSVGVTGTSNYNGAANFAYTVTANAQTSNSATATFSITAVDDAPISANISPAAFATNTQSVITLSYTDVELHNATVCSISTPTNVTVTQGCACSAGTCTVGVTSTLDYSGAASFLYTVTANGLVSNSSTATLTINSTDSAPVAANISPAAFNEDAESVITLSYTDADSDQATVCAITSPANVTVTQSCACAAGICTVGITGTAHHFGAASFAYTVTANSQVSNSATATLSIVSVDDAPVAAAITPPSFNEDIQSIITLSYTDVEDQATACTISDLSNVTVTQACACAAGICTVGVTGTADYDGAASFNYTVTANSVISNSVSATLTILPFSDPPIAANITPVAFNEDIQSVITLSYTDPDSDPATACAITSLTNVTVTQACACAAGTCTVGVTGSANYNGAAGFSYTVTANSQTSNTASATLSITAVDDAPTGVPLTPAAFNEDVQSPSITLTYSDLEGDQATSCALSGLSNVTVTTACTCTLGVCTVKVTGTANYNGIASFNYTVTANGLTSVASPASLTISSVPDAPTTANLTPAAFNEDTQSIITLTHTVVGGDAATTCATNTLSNVTVTQACACAAGVCTVGVTGTANYNGSGSFNWTVSSGAATSVQRSATFTINPVNDAPVLGAVATQNTNKSTASGAITFSFTDIDSTLACSAVRLTMTSSVTSMVANGAVTIGGTLPNCTATITPVAGATGTTSITITGTDPGGATATTVFNLNVNGVTIVWTDADGDPISNFDFGTPNTNATVPLKVQNTGNMTSAAVVMSDNNGYSRLTIITNTCTTLAAGASCDVTVRWEHGGSPGFRSKEFTATVTGGSSHTNSNTMITVSGTR